MIREMFIGVEGRIIKIPNLNYIPGYLQERQKNFDCYEKHLKKENFNINSLSKEENITDYDDKK